MNLMDYVTTATQRGAADLFILAGAPCCIRLGRELMPLDDRKLMPDDTKALITEIYALANREMDAYYRTWDDDFSFAVAGLARFRVNTYRQRGSMAAVIRVVSFSIPDWKELRIPEQVIELSKLRSGMVLVTGTADSGKSTTLACIVDRINRTRSCHIITLEDPIEYLHRDHMSIVSQREVAIDTATFPTALRACLRQSPDVIQLGEMRDLETIRAAMTAAETGHLLLTTLHTRSAVSTIDRIVDTFPAEQQEQIRIQLCSVLHTVISQQLLPKKGGGLVPAFEIMHMNKAVQSLIRDRKTHQVDNTIATSAGEGMISMDQYILNLYLEGLIERDTAIRFARNKDQLLRKLL
ncbi:MAG: PilT/PilU family type 4a pilus ATPase [Clostridia bacterium]|jgi:twitching motility protein PilT|nr:PilT/PilU family type 4a pilus ATPase [Clostridia bacterium]MBR0436635.1 PilT/PilU family type 4a pilus ATPase [Clostridia bacterium]MBR3129723.1 PilT/PilU family type 4a pilus ATPase [Clostridia bacterium]